MLDIKYKPGSISLPPEHRLLRSTTFVSSARELYLRSDVSCGSLCCQRGCRPTSPCLRRPRDGASHYFIPDASFLSEFLEVLELPEVQDLIVLSSVLEAAVRRGGGTRRAARIRALYTDVRKSAVQFDDIHCSTVAEPLLPQLEEGTMSKAQLSMARLLAAAQFYADEIGNALPIFVVSDAVVRDFGLDPASPEAMLEVSQGVHVASAAAYLARFWLAVAPVAALIDSLLAKRACGGEEGGAASTLGPALYAPHLSSAAIESAVDAGDVIRGRLIVSPRRRDLALVLRDVRHETALTQLARDFVVVQGQANLNRAVHGDTVALRLVASQAPSPSTPDREPPPPDDVEDILPGGIANAAAVAAAADLSSSAEPEGDGAVEEDQADRLLREIERGGATPASLGLPVGAVVGIDRRTARELVCTLDEADERVAMQLGASTSTSEGAGILGDRVRAVVCVPMDRRFPKIRIRTRNVTQLCGQRFVLRLDTWDRTSMYPSGHVVRTLGPVQDLKTEIEAVLVEAGAHWHPFCEAALAELPPVAIGQWRPSEEEVRRRRDLRVPEVLICSIDPVGCEDVDDALHARRLPGGGYEVGVHIADVSYFVREGSRLDGEASSRCTTLYLGPGDRRDMLPALLSADICSLLADVDRYANSVVWTFNDDLSLRSIWFGRTVIRSSYKLHYQQAQDILDGRPPARGDEIDAVGRARVRESLEIMRMFFRHFRDMRRAAGALELASAELSFETAGATKGAGPREPTSVKTKQTIEMMEIVAEFMILANGAVGERIFRAFPSCALLRRHGLPNPKALEQVEDVCREFGLPPPPKPDGRLGHGGFNLSLSTWLSGVTQQASPDVAVLVKASVTRAMDEAKYFSTGEVTMAGGRADQGTYHFGLALEFYTHFTSPIRRYADIVAHRQILRAVQDPGAVSLSAVPSSAAAASAAPSLGHANVAAAAATMNQRHREAKRAQKLCAELYLLLLMHRHPHIERAVVIGLSRDSRSVTVFLPGYHIKARVPLGTADGRSVVPFGCAVDGAQEGEMTQRVEVRWDAADATIVDRFRGRDLVRLALGDTCYVRVSSDGTRSHGPSLKAQLVSPDHPEALLLLARELERTEGPGAMAASPTRPVAMAPSPTRFQPRREDVTSPRPSTDVPSRAAGCLASVADALSFSWDVPETEGLRKVASQHVTALLSRDLQVQTFLEDMGADEMNQDLSDEEKERDSTQDRFLARLGHEVGAGLDLRGGILLFKGGADSVYAGGPATARSRPSRPAAALRNAALGIGVHVPEVKRSGQHRRTLATLATLRLQLSKNLAAIGSRGKNGVPGSRGNAMGTAPIDHDGRAAPKNSRLAMMHLERSLLTRLGS